MAASRQRRGYAPAPAQADTLALIRSASSSALEPLERRMMMAVNPVIVYNFDEADPASSTVTDSSAEGGVQNGTITQPGSPARVEDGQAGSQYALEFYGDGTLSEADFGRVDTVPLEGNLGRSASNSTSINTTHVGAANPWDAPGIAGMEEGAGGNENFWGFIDDHGRLADHEYLAEDYSIADIAVWPWVSRYEWQTVDLKQYPNVLRWYLAIAKKPATQKGYKVPKDVGEIPMP